MVKLQDVKLRSRFVLFDTFQSSKLALSWEPFGTGEVGQLARQQMRMRVTT